mgnify:FL=1
MDFNKKNEGPPPLKNFAKKKKIDVPLDILNGVYVKIPPIWYWEDVVEGKTVLMTMAFKIYGMIFGLSYSIEDDNFAKIAVSRNKLFSVVKESLDALLHHGKQVLDKHGNIDPRLVNEQEAIRWRYDKNWDKKVAAFNKLVRVAPITKEKAEKMKLL